jgi:hypothetical protein
MSHHEMTIADVLQDPLIRQMMDADGVSSEEFERLLIHSVSMLFDKGQARSLPQTQNNAATADPRAPDEIWDSATVMQGDENAPGTARQQERAIRPARRSNVC